MKKTQQSDTKLSSKIPDKKLLNNSLNEQLDMVRNELSGIERLLSLISHNKVVESISDILGSTLFRAKPMLFASVLALFGITLSYLAAKYYGFQLSGSEIIISFMVGWIIGLIYDILSHKNN